MKFSFALLCLTSQALAHGVLSLAERDAGTISGVLDNIKSDIQKLTTAAKAGGTDPEPLLKASNSLIQAIKDAKAKVDGSSELTLSDAVQLTQPVQDMAKLSQDLVDSLKAKRDIIEKLGYCDAVRTQTSGINDKSQALIRSIVSKVPEEAREIAGQLSAGLVKILDEAKSDFSEQNCKSGGGAKPPTTGGNQSTPGAGPSLMSTYTSTSAPAPAAASTSGPQAPLSSNPADYTPTAACPPVANGTSGITMGPTGAGGMTMVPTSTSSFPPVTAGAAIMGPAGALVLAVAAFVI